MSEWLLTILCGIVILLGGWGISCEYRAIKEIKDDEETKNEDNIS